MPQKSAQAGKAQAGLEYLLTYGWAFLLVVTIIGVLIFVVSPSSASVNFNSDNRQIMVRGGNVVSTGGADSVSLSLQNATGGAITITAISVDGTASGFKNDSGSAASLNGTLITSVPTVPIKVAAGGRMNFAAIDAPASGQLNGTITITFTTSTGYSKTAVIRASGRLGAAGAAGGGAPCGNNNIEGTEVCDGTALGGRTCITLGFSGGTPSCSADCASFNTSLCYLCGNGTCESSKGENYSNCLSDCRCGNSICDVSYGETYTNCFSDCHCGNHICDVSYGETYASCSVDCHCGNSICEVSYGETYANCLSDCHCGNSICDGHYGETYASCSVDCHCGNSMCEVSYGETYASCSVDCHCGNSICEVSYGETYANCLSDCHCGNHMCDVSYGETYASCSVDCHCGNHMCEASYGETYASCSVDCHCGNSICEEFYGETYANCPVDCFID